MQNAVPVNSDVIKLDLLRGDWITCQHSQVVRECLCLCSDVISVLSHLEALAREIGDSAYSLDSLCREQSEPVKDAGKEAGARVKVALI